MDWPIFVISLKDATERREQLLQQCAAHDISVEIVDAVDGRHGLQPDLEHKVDRDAAFECIGRKVTDGEFACALSHQMLYERILDENLHGAIILEDDALISSEFATFVHLQKFKTADFIQMDYDGAIYYRWSTKKLFGRVRLVKSVQNMALTSGYSLSAYAANYILSQSRPLTGVADWPCDLQPLKPKFTLPRLITQPDEPRDSSLEGERNLHIKSEKKKRETHRWKRFSRASYWRHWIVKRLIRKTDYYK